MKPVLKTGGMMGMCEMEEAVRFLFEKAQRFDVEFGQVRFCRTNDYPKLDELTSIGMWNLAAYGWLVPVEQGNSSHCCFAPSKDLVERVAKHTVEE